MVLHTLSGFDTGALDLCLRFATEGDSVLFMDDSCHLLFDRELRKVHLQGDEIEGYHREFGSHLDVALEVLAGRADAAPAIRSVANLLDLDFLPLRWERYDFLIAKHRFFQQEVQRFLNLLHEEDVKQFAQELGGYDLSSCGNMMFPDTFKSGDSD